jgi:hypothetical protein
MKKATLPGSTSVSRCNGEVSVAQLIQANLKRLSEMRIETVVAVATPSLCLALFVVMGL